MMRILHDQIRPYAYLQGVIRGSVALLMVLGLNGARVDPMLMELFADLSRNRHEVELARGSDVNRSDNLGLRKLPDV
jgi:hypothetical protein